MRMTHNKLGGLYTFLLTVLVFCMTACKPNPPRISSIINNPCSPPCWQNIEPGKTTTEEAIKLLNALPDVDKESIGITTTREPNDSIKWSWNSQAADFSGRIFIQEDIATLITIAPKEKMLQFKDVISKLGEPENVLAFRTKGERTIIAIFILYPTKGYGFLDYYVSSTQNLESAIAVKPEEEVKYIWFGEVNPFYQNLTNGKIDRLPFDFVERGIQRWNGYSQYKLLEY